MPSREPGDRNFTLDVVVSPADTAQSLGSGDLPVLATPRLLAWLEAATCGAAQSSLEPEQTTVGTQVQIEHLAASAVGQEVTVSASLVEREGRTLRFEVLAATPDGRVIGRGVVCRAVVDRGRFMAKVERGPA